MPSWTEEERKRLEEGQLIPGASLLVENEEASPVIKPDPTKGEIEEKLPEPEPEPTYDPRTIPSDHLVSYFRAFPENYLVDPQRLLTMQETQDRVGFLDYHAQDSEIDIRLYLFDAQQQIPEPYSLNQVAKNLYRDSPLTAVVFCFVGDPSRTILAFGGRGAEHVTQQENTRILDSARIKSLESSDTSAQVEAFIVQLSISLYWLEKSLEDIKIAAIPPVEEPERSAAGSKKSSTPGLLSHVKPSMIYIAISVSSFLVSLIAIAMIWYLWRKNKKYCFPVFELPRRLGADYGAGVGAVIGYRDTFGSPSHQRDQVPDYLMRS
ncbi:MAG: hypothetical protein AB8F34_03295 [Akkermansiaceae bacterium]